MNELKELQSIMKIVKMFELGFSGIVVLGIDV